MDNKPQFGPAGAEFFTDYKAWEARYKELGYHYVFCTSGGVAQNKDETCHGAWFIHTNRGWIVKEKTA